MPLAPAETAVSGEVPVVAAQAAGRVGELDGLRGTAIVLVILDHYVGSADHGNIPSIVNKLLNVLRLGASGVDLFFVLSGFLIGGILLGSRESPNYYKAFWARRFHRIMPVYYIWVSLYVVAYLVAKYAMNSDALDTAYPLWVYYLFLQNYFVSLNVAQWHWFSPVWSLAVEEQFYIVAPPLMRWLTPKTIVRFMASLVFIAPVLRYLALTRLTGKDSEWAAYLFTPCRSDALALGVLAAVLSRSDAGKEWVKRNVRAFHIALLVLGVAVLASIRGMVDIRDVPAQTLGRSVLSLFYTALLLVVYHYRTGVLAAVFRNRWLREIGLLSYCVYMVHLGVDSLLQYLILGHGPSVGSAAAVGITALSVGISFAIAKVSWTYMEGPLIARGHRYRY